MPDCVLSTQNRFYVDLESAFGQVPTIGPSDRIAAVALNIEQRTEVRRRRDKTGSRTFTGVAPGSRKRTSFDVTTYLTENDTPSAPPAVGRFVEASLGAPPVIFSGGTAGVGSSATSINFSSAHGLALGQAFCFSGEIRFVESIVDTTTVTVSAPFSVAPLSGEAFTAAVSYFPATDLPSVSVFDYWDPASAVQRILIGAACNDMAVRVNGDYHELEFSGEAQDVIDSVSFAGGEGGLGSFPTEPAVSTEAFLPVPGNLGQVWLGNPASKFLTLTSATLRLGNDLDFRVQEFGTRTPQCIAPGQRNVTADFELFEADDASTRSLYAAARAESTIQVMFQLGEVSGQKMGVYLPTVVPRLPQFVDDDRILRWKFENSRAQGLINDEIVVAFA
jgi:hypothetical protein